MATPASRHVPRPIRLLLVDDHAPTGRGMRARLQQVPDLEVVAEAGSAAEAVSCLAACRPRLALLDIVARQSDGIDPIALLLERDADLRILLISRCDSLHCAHRALQAGVRGYVERNDGAAEIVTAIEAVAAGYQFLSSALSRRLYRNQCPRPVLSGRESQILSALARGLTSREIADGMALSVRTIEAHRQSIKRRLCLDA